MSIQQEKSAIVQMTEKLCQTILEQPEYKEIYQKINTFSNNEIAKKQYQTLFEYQTHLQRKQQQGIPITPQENKAFQMEYEELLKNTTAREFIEAQKAIEEIEQTVNNYVSTTIKLGRLPKQEELSVGACGCGNSSCGCSGA